MISSKEAKDLLLKAADAFKPTVGEKKLHEAIQCVLAHHVKALCDSPPFHQSAMDGFAVRWDDAKNNKKFTLSQQKENRAGFSNSKRLNKGECIPIYTGARLPVNADVVLRQEDVDVKNNIVVCNLNKVERGDNVRLRASHFKKSDVIAESGKSLNAARLALIAHAGVNKVKVFLKPNIHIIVSGDELKKAGESLGNDGIYESNSIMLQAALLEHNFSNLKIFLVKDQASKIETRIKKSLHQADIILISGGISVGKYDFVYQALQKNKIKTVFHKVKQKPGKPFYFGIGKKKYVFGLPGNPAASLTCFYEYVLPFLQKISKVSLSEANTKKSVVNNAYEKKAGLTHFLKGYISHKGLEILPDQESYKLNSFAKANCLIVVPEETQTVQPGDILDYHLI